MSRESYHRSCLLNAERERRCAAIVSGVDPGIKADMDGWYTVSYHLAGKPSAFVQQAKLRQRWPKLDTQVGYGIVEGTNCAVIKVRLKDHV